MSGRFLPINDFVPNSRRQKITIGLLKFTFQ
jgi:hypothetical protein